MDSKPRCYSKAGGRRSAKHLAFAWYVRLNRERQLEEADDLLNVDDDLTPDDLYAKLDFPIFLERANAIQDLQGLKDQRDRDTAEQRRRRSEEDRQREERRTTLGQFGMSGISSGFDRDAVCHMSTPNPGLLRSLSYPHAELNKERDTMDTLEVEIRHHMRTIKDFLQTTSSNSESSPAITWALVMVALLFLVGVVYPLSFLPTPSSWTPALEIHGFWARVFSLRGLLLTAISGIFLAALTMFAIMNRRLRYPSAKIKELQAFTRIATYSPYYAVAEENEKIAREMTPTE